MQENNHLQLPQKAINSGSSFVLTSIHTYLKTLEQQPVDLTKYSKSLMQMPNIALAFTVASSSDAQIRIQEVYLHVTQAISYKRSTFPAYGLGGNGVEPIVGFVEIKPIAGLYLVNATRHPQVGRGIEPADFHIRIFCQDGYKYLLKVAVDWMDINQQDNLEHHEFDTTVVLDMPSILRWKNLASTARSIKVFYNGYEDDLANEIKQLPWLPNYTILWSSIFPDQKNEIKDANILLVPQSEMGAIQDLYHIIGGPGSSTDTRNFIILDSTYLLLQNDDWVTAEIVEDAKQIKLVEAIYDDLTMRSRSSTA